MKNSLQCRLLMVCALLLINCGGQTSVYKDIGTKLGVYENPNWSPDGKTIIVLYRSSSSSDPQLIQVSKDGTNWNEIVPASFDLSLTSESIWINDDTIVFTRVIPDLDTLTFTSDLVFFDVANETTNTHTIPGSIWNLSLDSVNQQLAVTQEHIISFYDIKSGNFTTLVKDQVDRFEEGGVFSPSAQTIAFVKVSGVGSHAVFSLATLEIDTGKQHILVAQSEKGLGDLAWSPDGQWIAVRQISAEAGYKSSILLIRSDGSEQKLVNLDFIQPVDISWAPSGNLLAITSLGRPGQNSLYVVDISQWLDSPSPVP